MNADYSQPIKNKARNKVIEKAIQTLTANRTNSTLTSKEYVRKVRDFLINSENYYDQNVAKDLSDEAIERWENFYQSIVYQKEPSNLKIAYLCGPNPENDLRVLCQHGILPENIWAFESEYSTYSKAIQSALNSEFPFIKIINGGIDNFLEASPQRFDIIYLDFCGPLPSRNKDQKTLYAISKILSRHSLNSPGILITNFSLPNKEGDNTGRQLIAKLVSNYLYPKSFLESNNLESDFIEGPIAHGQKPKDFLKIVETDLENFYGQFITRLLIDHSSLISPYTRFPQSNFLFKKFFNIKDKTSLKESINAMFHFNEDFDGGDVIVDSGMYPILWTLASLNPKLNCEDPNYSQDIYNDPEFKKFSELFLNQLDISNNKDNLTDSFSQLSFLLNEGNEQEEFWSEGIKNLKTSHEIFKYHQFCDLLMFHQIFEMLFRQVAIPYHINISESKRWKYKAKDNVMFMDMLIMDECRYLYDWMPTIDMISEAFSDKERQLIYRFALDGISKHRSWYNPEYFFGTAVVDKFTDGFEAKTLSPRENILE